MITLPMMRWVAMVSNSAEAWHQWPPPRANAVMTFPKLAMSGTGPCWSLGKPLKRISVIFLQKMMTMICDFEILWHMQNFTCWVHPMESKHIIHHDLDSWSHCPLVDTSTKASISAPPGHISCSTASGKLQRFVEEQAWRMLLQKNVSSESPGDPWKLQFLKEMEALFMGILWANVNIPTGLRLLEQQQKQRHYSCFAPLPQKKNVYWLSYGFW